MPQVGVGYPTHVTGDGFDTAIGGFLAGRLAAARGKTARGRAGVRVRRRAIAVGTTTTVVN
jgi:hypothetical protein